MAITVRQQPQTITPAFNPNIWVVSSNNSGEDGYKYICTIDIINKDGTTINETIVLEKSPTPSGVAFFDVSKIIQNYVSYDFGATESIRTNPNTYKIYTTTFSATWHDGGNEATGITTIYAFFGGLSFENFLTWNYVNYSINGGSGYKFLTNEPNNLPVINTAAGFLYFNLYQEDALLYINYNSYTSSGALIKSVIIDTVNTGAFATQDDGWLRLPAGFVNINLINNAGILVGQQPILPSNTNSYSAYVSQLLADLVNNGTFIEAAGGWTTVEDFSNPCSNSFDYQVDGVGLRYANPDNSCGLPLTVPSTVNIALTAGIYIVGFVISNWAQIDDTDPFDFSVNIGAYSLSFSNADWVPGVNGTYKDTLTVPIGGVLSVTSRIDGLGSFNLDTLIVRKLTQVTETRTFVLDNNCTKYDTYILHFLNALGGFDTMYFNGKSLRSTDINKSFYSQNINSLSGNSYGYSINSREQTQFNTSTDQSYKLTSGWISEAQALWLEELLTSPVVFWQKTYDKNIAVNVSDTSFETKIKNNEKLIFISFTVNISIKDQRQSL